MEERLNKKESWDLGAVLRHLLQLFIIVGLGFFAVNQTLEYFYKAEFLKAPCNICGELNPDVAICIKELNTKASYPDGLGGWSDPLNRTVYNFSIELDP